MPRRPRTIPRARVGQADARRDFDDLLMAALHRAIALVQMHHVAVLVAQDLHLDVLGARDVAFPERPPDCRTRGRLRPGPRPADRQVAGFMTTRMPRPPPPNAALMISGKPISLAIFSASARSSPASSVPAAPARRPFAPARAPRFVAHQSQQLRPRPDERDARLRAGRANSAFSDKNRNRDG
jgi:hypothetical protein